MNKRFYAYMFALFCAASCSGGTWAQEESVDAPLDSDTNIREMLEQEQRADELIEAKKNELSGDFDLPRTPLQLMILIADAADRNDTEGAGEYLDMRYLPDELNGWNKAQLMGALRVVWTQQNLIDITELSDNPQGRLDDNLPEYRDLLGVIVKVDGEQVPIYLQRIPDGAGGKTWKISNASVARVPELWEDLGYGPIAVWLQRHLPSKRLFGLDSWQIIAAIIFLFLSWFATRLLCVAILKLVQLAPNSFGTELDSFCRGPLRLFLFLLLFRLLMDELALSLTARVYLNSSGLDYIAITILLLGLISLVRDYNIRRLAKADNRHYVALLKPFSTIIKFFAVTLIGLIWANRAGYNMSAILAGLGVGSLAVALAAQKTLENVIGAITLYTARPVNPGDLCRFGDVVGVVEEIGLRSTMIRTLNRTMLAVPNSVFSSVEVENFSHRDRIRYYRHLELQMATADQLRVILGRLRELFLSHQEVIQDTVSIRLEKIEAATAVIRVDSSISTTDYQHYLAAAEDLNLRTIELVHDAGAVFSGPGQVLQVREFYQASEETQATIQAELDSWQTEGGPFPDISAERKSALRGLIKLKPKS
ncbi:MAG: mechanosensitive ion channel domain-containing protein [Pseudomonadota bacterium]